MILGLIGVAIVATGNADPTFATDWSAYILGGAGLTILISAVSITLRHDPGDLRRPRPAVARTASINGVASLYVSLVRGTPLLVQIYFIFFALPQIGDRPRPDPERDRRACRSTTART